MCVICAKEISQGTPTCTAIHGLKSMNPLGSRRPRGEGEGQYQTQVTKFSGPHCVCTICMAPSFFSESHSQNFQGIPTTVTTQEKLSMGSCKDYHPSLQTAPCGRPAPGPARLAQSTQGPPLSLRPPLSSDSALPSPPANPHQPPPTFLDNPFFQASRSSGDKCSS